jgi:hypothetical protein
MRKHVNPNAQGSVIRLVAKYSADAMRVFSCVKRVKILLVALLQIAIFTGITRKNPSPIISRLNSATSLMTSRVYEQRGLYAPLPKQLKVFGKEREKTLFNKKGFLVSATH